MFEGPLILRRIPIEAHEMYTAVYTSYKRPTAGSCGGCDSCKVTRAEVNRVTGSVQTESFCQGANELSEARVEWSRCSPTPLLMRWGWKRVWLLRGAQAPPRVVAP